MIEQQEFNAAFRVLHIFLMNFFPPDGILLLFSFLLLFLFPPPPLLLLSHISWLPGLLVSSLSHFLLFLPFLPPSPPSPPLLPFVSSFPFLLKFK